MRLPVEGSSGPVVIVIVLPSAMLVIEKMDIVTDAVLVEQLVKLLTKPTPSAATHCCHPEGDRHAHE